MEAGYANISFKPPLTGRDEEISKLMSFWERAKEGKGSTVFISGEAGVGKTRLVNELIERLDKDVKIIKCWCLSESLEPLMPFKQGFRKEDLSHIISEKPPPKVISTYLIDKGGLLVTKAERSDTDLDPDIFASMLDAVGNFIKDSLSMMGEMQGGELNTIGYGKHSILIQSNECLSLASVIEGESSEFLIDDMRKTLENIGDRFASWNGDMESSEKVRPYIEWFIDSRKYSGRYLAKDPKLKQENLFDKVLLGLQRISSESPVVLFLDDLQWAESTTLKLLHYLSRNTKNDRILIIGNYRPEDVIKSKEGDPHPFKTIMQNMSREHLFQALQLQRLDENSVKNLMIQTLEDEEISEDLIDEMYTGSDGNPFFLLEVMKMLVYEGHLIDQEGVLKLKEDIQEIKIPSKVYDLVVRRLDRLVDEQKDILECASVVGEEFESRVIGEIIGISRMKLLKNLNEIQRLHKLIISIEKKYRFEHRQIREVLYFDINDELREEYHRLVAESYELIYKGKMEEYSKHIAYHFFKAKEERAVNYLLKLGGKAKDEYANEEALRFYKDALSLAVHKSDLKEIHDGLGEVFNIIGKYEKSLEHYENALDNVENELDSSRLHGKIAEVLNNQGEYKKALEQIEIGIELCEENNNLRCKLFNINGWVFMLQGLYGRSIQIFNEEIKLARELDDTKSIGRALHDLGTVLIRRGDYGEAEELLKESVGFREECEDIEGLGDTFNSIGVVHKNKGDMDRALYYYNKSMEIEREIGSKNGIARSLNNIATIYWYKGELNKALDNYEKCLKIVEGTGNKGGIALALSNIGNIYADKGERETALTYYEESMKIREYTGDQQGIAISLNNIGNIYIDLYDLDKALEYHNRSLEIESEIGDKAGIAYSLNSIALIHQYKGDISEAIDHYERSLEKATKVGESTISVYNLCGLAELCLKNDIIDKAMEYAEKALQISLDTDGESEEGTCYRILGMVFGKLGTKEKAIEHFEKSINVFEMIGDKRGSSRTHYEYGMFLRGEEGEEFLRKALDMFERMNLVFWVQKARNELKKG